MSEEVGLDFAKTLELVVLPRLDQLDAKIDRRLDKIEDQLQSKANASDLILLEARVSVNEGWRNRMMGAIAVTWAAILTLSGLIARLFH